jgi:signal transduction histidine kinase
MGLEERNESREIGSTDQPWLTASRASSIEIQSNAMGSTDGTARLRDNTESLLQEIRKEAETRLWHLDQKLWSRNGVATRCLKATLEELDTLPGLRGIAEAAQTLADANVRLRVSEPHWIEMGLNWADTAALLDIVRQKVHQVLSLGSPDGAAWLVQAALNSLRAEIGESQLRAQAAELERQRDDLLATQHLTGRFLANASHEVRTPLTAVLGFSELLLEETYGELSAEQRTAVGHIENSARNLLEIINNILDLMQFRAGKLDLQFRRVAPAPLLRNIYQILLPLAERRKVRFIEQVPEDLGTIQADEGIVRHIVYYLLESGLRATPEDGDVVLSAHRSDGILTIVTHDTALHFPPEAIEKMNDAYPILENSPARGYEGWEIGLPLVRRYVDLHAGTLDIQSSSDDGTTIRVHLPAKRPPDREIRETGWRY